MKFSKLKPAYLLVVVLAMLGTYWSCQDDEGIDSIEQTQISIQKNGEEPCADKTITICGTGPTVAEARNNWGAMARVECYQACSSQMCDDERSCLLKNVKPIGKEVITRIPNPENPSGEEWFKITIQIKCSCKCGKCAGQKLVGRRFSASNPNQGAALSTAKQAALAWCKSDGCPPIAGCKNPKVCVGRGSTVQVLKSQFDPASGLWDVEVLLTKCRCACGRAAGG